MTAALEGGEWSAARPGRTLPPGKTRYPFYRRLGEPQGQSGRAEKKSRPHRDSIPDRPARSSVAILTELPGPHNVKNIARKTYKNYTLITIDRNRIPITNTSSLSHVKM